MCEKEHDGFLTTLELLTEQSHECVFNEDAKTKSCTLESLLAPCMDQSPHASNNNKVTSELPRIKYNLKNEAKIGSRHFHPCWKEQKMRTLISFPMVNNKNFSHKLNLIPWNIRGLCSIKRQDYIRNVIRKCKLEALLPNLVEKASWLIGCILRLTKVLGDVWY